MRSFVWPSVASASNSALTPFNERSASFVARLTSMLPRCLTLQPVHCASTSVTLKTAPQTLAFSSRPLGQLGMPRMGAKLGGRSSEIGVACEDPLLDRIQPTPFSTYPHIRFKFFERAACELLFPSVLEGTINILR